MPRMRLLIDRPSEDLWASANRASMLNVSRSLVALQWSYKVAEGGCWDGQAKFKLKDSTETWDYLVSQGRSGAAWIYWDRADAADELVEDSDLLWFGQASDARMDQKGDVVTLKLRGAGRWMKNVTYTGVHSSESLRDIANTVLNQVITDGDSPITAVDLDNDGVLKKKVSLDFDRTPIDRIMGRLQELAGGPAMCAWGVRPSAAASSYGTAYFKLFAGHLYEKTTSTERKAWSVGRSELLDMQVRSITDEIFNEIEVVGDEKPTDPQTTDPIFYSATAKNDDSIKRYGRRRAPVHVDSSLVTDGQCAQVAAGLVKEKSPRKLDVKLTSTLALGDRVTIGGASATARDHQGLLQDAIRNGGKIVTVRGKDRPYRAWGDSRAVMRCVRDATNGSYARLNLANQPGSGDEVSQDLTTLSTGDKRLFVMKGDFRQVTYSSQGLMIMELDRWLAFYWAETSGGSNVWKLQVDYRDAAHTWTNLLLSAGTVTTAQLQAEHALAIEVSYDTATTIAIKVWWTAGTNTQLISTTLAHANLSSQGSNGEVYFNAAGSSALDTFANPGDQADVELGIIEVWKAWASDGGTFLDLHWNSQTPFKRWGDLVWRSNFAHTDDGTSTGDAFGRYAFEQSTRKGGYDLLPKGGASKTQFGDPNAPILSHRNYTWLLGDVRAPVEYGTHLEIIPQEAKCVWNGPNAPLTLEIKGEGGTRSITRASEELASQIEEANEVNRV